MKCITPKEIHEDMVQIFDEDSPSNAIVKKWGAEFKLGRDNKEDDLRLGRPETSTLIIKLMPFMVLDKRRFTDQLIAKSIGISSDSVHTVWTRILAMSKRSARSQECWRLSTSWK